MKKTLFILLIFLFLINITEVFSQENGKLLFRTTVTPEGVVNCFPEYTIINFKLKNLTSGEIIFDDEIEPFENVPITYNNFQYNTLVEFNTTYNLTGVGKQKIFSKL